MHADTMAFLNSVKPILAPEPNSKAAEFLLMTPAYLIVEAIGTLAAREQVVLALLYFEELEAGAVANVLGLTDSEVISICDRAVVEMEEAIERFQSDHLSPKQTELLSANGRVLERSTNH